MCFIGGRDHSAMNREKIILIVCVVLAGTTATAWLQNVRLRKANEALQNRVVRAPVSVAAPPLSIPPAKPIPAAVAKAVEADDKAELEALSVEVEELRLRLAERDRKLAEVAERAATNRNNEGRFFRGGEGRLREAELAELKEKDPERFQEIEKQRTEFRERIKTAAGDQVSFLESVDVTRWPADQQENHARLLELAASFAASLEQSPDAAGDEVSRRQMFEKMREAGELMEAERTMLLNDTARQMGFDEKGSKEFVEYIQAIQKATSPRGFFPGRGPARE